MAQLQFFGPSGRDADNRAANSARLINCYLEPVQAGGRTGLTIKAAPGMMEFTVIPGIFVRAIGEVGGLLYAVSNGRLYSVTSAGVVTNLGAIDDSANATLTGNNGVVTLTVDGRYFVRSGGTISEPAAGAFSAMGACDFIGGYTVITELNGRRFQWSGLADGTTLPGLNFSTADGRDDNAIRPYQINGSLYIFKERSHEVWYVTGQAGANAFERMAGGVVDIGLKAFGLICRTDVGAFMVGDDNRAYVIAEGMTPVSNPAVETAIATQGPTFCFTYDDEGHTFCAIAMTGGPAWVFDTATGEWHERAYGIDFDPWPVVASARWGNAFYVALAGGDLLSLGPMRTDAGVPLLRRMVSRTLANDGQRFCLSEVEIFPRQGFDAASVMLRMSRDNGMTWSAPKVRGFAVGEYGKRLIWRQLGQFRQATAEITISDAAAVTMNAEGRVVVS
jgi:hypothetical protein